MKKSLKNRIAGAAAVLLAGSMAFSMTGCGSSSDNGAGQQTATDQKTEEMKNIQRLYMLLNHLTIFRKICLM